MESLFTVLIRSLEQVWITFTHNWPFLAISVLVSVGLRLYVNPEKVSAFLTRYQRAGVVGATAVAVTTPFCSCGTTAVVLGMMASTLPWSPIVAFMVASPLTSPEEFVYSAGIFGWPFAIAFFLSSILLGLLGGAVAEFFESRGWLANQARFQARMEQPENSQAATNPALPQSESGCSCEAARQPALQPVFAIETSGAAAPAAAACACSSASIPASPSCGCESSQSIPDQKGQPDAEPANSTATTRKPVTARQWTAEILQTGRQLLLMFTGFAFIGYVLNGLIPSTWVTSIFGGGNAFNIPLAATLGLPLYINTEGSLPLVRAFIDSGMSQGAALAFLITGAGTSFGAIAGALTIARWRVIAVVVGTLWTGAIILGYAYDFLLSVHLF